MKLMVPNTKLLPMFSRAAAPKVISSTGTSAKEWVVRVRTSRMMTTATIRITSISSASMAFSS